MKNKLNCVLLIDDDEPTNFFNRMVLEDVNCARTIHVAESGELALDFLRKISDEEEELSPDLIFLDINMPAMSGWEFLERYATLERHRSTNTVVVMLTTSLNPDDRALANKIPDVSAFETKPLTDQKLAAIIQRHFPEMAI